MESTSTDGGSPKPAALQAHWGCVHPSPVQEQQAHTLWELNGSLNPRAPAQNILISTQPFTIGRDWDNALQLADATISRRHAELLLVENDLFVRDINSRNGTFLNGRRISNFEKLRARDMLQFGSAVFTVRAPSTAKAEPAFNPHATLMESSIGAYTLAN